MVACVQDASKGQSSKRILACHATLRLPLSTAYLCQAIYPSRRHAHPNQLVSSRRARPPEIDSHQGLPPRTVCSNPVAVLIANSRRAPEVSLEKESVGPQGL